MSRQFSLHTVYRMVSNELLAQFFQKLDHPCWGMDWDRRPRRHVASIDCLMEWFPPRQREAAELILRHVFDLACANGLAAIRDAAQLLDADLLARIPSNANLYCQALWTWLHAPHVFDQALLFHELDGLSWWTKRDDLPRVPARTDTESLNCLAGDIARLLQREQGRGGRCTIEHISRNDGIDYYFCFPDDYAKTVIVHNQAGRLVTKTLRQTFEIVFAYCRQAGSLELSARLGSRLKQQLEESFAWMILAEQVGPRKHRPLYDLNRLKERDFLLDTDPSDHVQARVRRLCLDLPDKCRSIILQSKNGARDAMQQMVEECLNKEHVALSAVNITQAQIQLQFASNPRHGRGTMTFEVAHPDRCSLRRHRPEWVAIGHKHLRMWRVEK